VIAAVKDSGVKADILQRLPEVEPRFDFNGGRESIAAFARVGPWRAKEKRS